MLACTETVTFVRCDGQAYTCTTVAGVSWYDKTVVAMEGSGLAAANAVKIRIPAAQVPSGWQPAPGDHVVRGTVGSISTPAQLTAHDARLVLEVGDNLRGRFPHLAVTAK